VKEYLFISQELSRRNWTVGILRGEFAKSREPSDLAEEQGSYGECFSKQAQEKSGP
jgi:hypothetical protein